MTSNDSTEDRASRPTAREMFEAVTEVVVPRWPMPLKGATNPGQAEAERLHTAWLKKYDLAGRSCRPETMRLSIVTSYAYPNADVEVLALAADLTAWLFVVDELFDTGETGLSVASARAVISSLDAPPTAPSPACSIPKAHSLLLQRIRDAYDDLASRLRDRMTPPHWRVFTDHLGAYYGALAAEAANREQGIVPDLEDYLAIRRFSAGTQCQLDLVELAQSTRLPRHLYESQPFHELVHATCDVANWANDVFSAAKEYEAGDVHNLVLILQGQANCSLPEAAVLAVDHIEKRLREMQDAQIRLTASLVRHGASPAALEAGQRWADGLRCFLNHGAWYLDLARYSTAEHTTPGGSPPFPA
ncbi:terpene synthase family protein [Streptomyces globisporus]|uniref:terpene synthase family protein n=1 Tax=Streptomyces globisporus TaxID=1908 RepID=UPI0036CA4A9F